MKNAWMSWLGVASILSACLGVGGCRTRLYDLDSDAGRSPVDAALDYWMPPDLLPPPDLILPFVCLNVYTLDTNGMLASFDTEKLQFTDVKKLKCPGAGGTPNSMSIARDGSAWVSFNKDDKLFRVDTRTGECFSTFYMPDQPGFTQFGMGFVSDVPGGNTETLFIASTGNPGALGIIGMPSLRVNRVADLLGQPELTGTADAELWGFFPDANLSFIAQIDKQTGATNNTIPLPNLAGTPSSWAFAFWGGSFWVFLKRNGEAATRVYQVDRMTGIEKLVVPGTNRNIVGAGVSTCAPIGLDH